MATTYICDPYIIPALMPRDFADLESKAGAIADFALLAQIDVMDGAFAPTLAWPYADMSKTPRMERYPGLPHADRLSYEVHLMVEQPREVGHSFIQAGAKRLIAHVESFAHETDMRRTVEGWRAAGLPEVGLAILLSTPLTALEPMLQSVDVVQVMGIEQIGYQGRPFDERALLRVEELHAEHPDLMVAVDGGVNEGTVESLVRAGANRLVVGAALHAGPDTGAAFARIHDRAMRGCAPVESAPELA